jgi:hypothetical protein
MNTLTWQVRSLAVASVAAAVVGAGSPAMATWYYASSSSPMRAMQDGASQAEGYGYGTKCCLDDIRNHKTFRDPRPGGDTAYHRSDWATYRGEWSGWYGEDRDGTTSGSWQIADDYFQYTQQPGPVDQVKLRTYVCEDQRPLNPDPCSDKPQHTWGV